MADKIVVEFYNKNAQTKSDEEKVNVGQDVQSIGTSNTPTDDSASKSAITSALINAGKNMLMSGIQVYGDMTGNYNSTKQIQDAFQVGSTVLMLMQWPVGTIAGLTRIAVQTTSSFINQRNADYTTDLLRERIGNSKTDNSQGGSY